MKVGLVTVLSEDIHIMKHFYSKVLGFEIIEELPSYVEFRNEGVRFAITTREVMYEGTHHTSYKERRKGQSFELAFPAGTPKNVDKMYQKLIEKGATPISSPEMMPWGRKTGFFADPEGNIHEIYSDKVEHMDAE
jgi:catechol-2,3-dioxygenase